MRTIEITRQGTEEWIEKVIRRRLPHLEAEYRKTWETFYTLMKGVDFDAALFARVEQSVASKPKPLWDSAVDWLKMLAQRFPDQVSDLISRMSCSKEAHMRFKALCIAGRRTPRPLLIDVILRGITDRNAEVRWKAIQKARGHKITEAIPAIEQHRKVEKSQKVVREIDLLLPLLRDGYILEPEGDGFLLTVSGAGGLRSARVSKEEIARRGMQNIVKEWKAELDEDATEFILA